MVIAMARDRSRVEAFRLRRGDRVSGRGGERVVKAVRERSGARGLDVIAVFKGDRAMRAPAGERVSVVRGVRWRR